MTPEEAAEAYWLGPLRTEDFVPIATAWVAEGVADDAVVAAAGVPARADPREAREAFIAALESLGAWLVSRRVALHKAVTRVAAELAAERIGAADASRKLCGIVMADDVMYAELDSPWLDFARLCWLSDVEPEYSDLGGESALRRVAVECCSAAA